MGLKLSEILTTQIIRYDGEVVKIEQDKTQKTLQLHVFFEDGSPFSAIIDAEKALKKMLDYEKVKILPTLPPKCLTADYVKDICVCLAEDLPFLYPLCEAEFDFDSAGRVLFIAQQYNNNDLVARLKTDDFFTKTVKSIFGADIFVEFLASRELDPDSEEYKALVDRPDTVFIDEPETAQTKTDVVNTLDIVREEQETSPENAPKNRKTVYMGKNFDLPSVPISAVYTDSLREDVVVEGEVLNIEKRLVKDGKYLIFNFGLMDNHASIGCKIFFRNPQAELADQITEKMYLKMRGKVEIDSYKNCEIFSPKDILLSQKPVVVDMAQEKRVELHAHTSMSQLDAIPSPTALIERAYNWGHKAVAITDHGVVQAFPEAYKAIKKIKKENKDADFKVIYGMEGYIVNDVTEAVTNAKEYGFDMEFTVFDTETTGTSPENDRLIEIGAVKIKSGEVTGSFSTFVDPERPISEKSVELTGISDETVKGAPKEQAAVKAFIEFAGDSVLIAHNADFDVNFINAAARRHSMSLDNCYIDTLTLSRILYPGLRKYKLNFIAENLGLGDFNHHRAIDDTKVLANIFLDMLRLMRERGCSDVGKIDETLTGGSLNSLHSYHCIILAKNQTGLRNLYELVSLSQIDYFYKQPRIPKSILKEKREGLIIGSACEAGELYSAVAAEQDFGKLFAIARFYDYLEIQPLCNNEFMVRKGYVKDNNQLIENNKKIAYIAKQTGKRLVATCDSHFLDPADSVYREIILAGKKMNDSQIQTPLFFRTTNEMLKEFSYLSDSEAYDAVIRNPVEIAREIEDIVPIPDKTFPPMIDGAEDFLKKIVTDTAESMYGSPLPEIVEKRILKELNPVVDNGFATSYYMAHELVKESNKNGYIVGSRGSVGSTVLALFTGVSEVNPLPPHYRCAGCKYSDFTVDCPTGVGLDMPAAICPKCGENMIADGVDIPFETFMGFSGEKVPDIDLNFSDEYQTRAHKHTEELFGSKNCFKAGTITLIKDNTAFGYVSNYCEEKGLSLPKAEQQRLANGCVGVKLTTGQHPGGIVLLPEGMDINEITPVQHPANDRNSGVITTHFDYHSLNDALLKLDELGHQIPTTFKYLKDATGIDFVDVPMNDEKALSLFSSVEALGVTPEQIDSSVGSFALPEMGTEFVRQMLFEAQPKTIADLLQISGLSHGKGVWLGNAQDLIRSKTCTISTVIGLRDNIMLYLIGKGMDEKLAYTITEYVRKPPVKQLLPEYVEVMKKLDVPDWYIESCNKIEYMFPKAHASAYVISALKLAWFKVHRPLEFYAVYFTVRGEDIDYRCAVEGLGTTKRMIQDIKEKGRAATAKEKKVLESLQVMVEMFARGYSFKGIDLKHSRAKTYNIVDGEIYLPYIAIAGIGETAANNIAAAVQYYEYHTVEGFVNSSGLSPSLITLLKEAGAFDDMPESDQYTLF